MSALVPDHLIISFDPGIINLGVAILWVRGTQINLFWSHVYNVEGTPSPDPLKIQAMLREVQSVATHPRFGACHRLWVVEYQPPISRTNAGLVRKNTWVEAGIVMWCLSEMEEYKLVSPSSVKHYFLFPKVEKARQYSSNKRISIAKAREILGSNCPPYISDHVSDAVLNGVYALDRFIPSSSSCVDADDEDD